MGTAPTSAMVITKFVYRHSWKTNFINIKGIARDSITIMKLTKEQSAEIKNQQSQNNKTKRVIKPNNIIVTYYIYKKKKGAFCCQVPQTP